MNKNYLSPSLRNRAKGNCLTKRSVGSMMLKTIFACVSRVMLFSAWLYVTNEGQFSSLKTLVGYYSIVLALIIFHFFFNNKRPSCSSAYCIGLTFLE